MSKIDQDEVAPLPAHHPLYGCGLRRKDICPGGCRGWGEILGLFNSSIKCAWCGGTGLYEPYILERARRQLLAQIPSEFRRERR